MELWIRSQDKQTLSRANNLWIMNNQIWLEVPFYEHHKKIGLSVAGHNHKIATYKTKKRAVEVLDEIQQKLYPQLRVVYKMYNPDLEKEELKIKKKFGNAFVITDEPQVIQQLDNYVIY